MTVMSVPGLSRTGRTGPRGGVADEVRAVAAASGTSSAGDTAGKDAEVGPEIVRRAVRGADELLLVRAHDDSWWVTRRVEGVVRVCMYIGDVEAERDFDLFLASPSPRGAWVEQEVPATAA